MGVRHLGRDREHDFLGGFFELNFGHAAKVGVRHLGRVDRTNDFLLFGGFFELNFRQYGKRTSGGATFTKRQKKSVFCFLK